MHCISIVRSLYFRILSASFLITFLSPEIATSINVHVPFSLSRIIMSGLLLGIVLSVCTCWFIVIIIIIIIIPVITFMQGIYNYIPGTNHVSRAYSVAYVLYLQIVLHVILIRPWKMFRTFYISTFRSMCAVPNTAGFFQFLNLVLS
jgi:hydrogenase/urease accessory protein HupE